jgi:hypothetical protein
VGNVSGHQNRLTKTFFPNRGFFWHSPLLSGLWGEAENVGCNGARKECETKCLEQFLPTGNFDGPCKPNPQEFQPPHIGTRIPGLELLGNWELHACKNDNSGHPPLVYMPYQAFYIFLWELIK